MRAVLEKATARSPDLQLDLCTAFPFLETVAFRTFAQASAPFTVARAVADLHRLPSHRRFIWLLNYRRTTVSCTGVMRGAPETGCASTKTSISKTSRKEVGVSTSRGAPSAIKRPAFKSKMRSGASSQVAQAYARARHGRRCIGRHRDARHQSRSGICRSHFAVESRTLDRLRGAARSADAHLFA